MKKLTTEDLVAGQILRLPVFMNRAEMGEWGWRKLRKDARAKGIKLCSQVGRQVYVNVDRFQEYMDACEQP
ncbi:MAG: hypothetical protein ABGZ23_18790 [Fuerstiella sp.]